YAYDGLFTKPFTDLKKSAAGTGINLNLELAGANYEELDQRVQSSLLAGSPPQLTMMGLNRVRPYVEAGRIAPLDDLINGDRAFAPAQYDQGFLDLMTSRGKLSGLPLAVSTPILYINTDLFKAAGLDPAELPDTWERTIAIARTIVASHAAKHGIYVDWS